MAIDGCVNPTNIVPPLVHGESKSIQPDPHWDCEHAPDTVEYVVTLSVTIPVGHCRSAHDAVLAAKEVVGKHWFSSVLHIDTTKY
jgi:hypothetical protein